MMRVSYFYPKFATQNKSNEDKNKTGLPEPTEKSSSFHLLMSTNYLNRTT